MAMANGGHPPKFSKYSGVVQWANGFFLWVNLSPPSDHKGVGGYYPNMFLEEGRFLTWFGGSMMRPGMSLAVYRQAICVYVLCACIML